MTMEINVCSKCGSESIKSDTEFEDMWYCMDCGNRFPKEQEGSLAQEEKFSERDDWEDEGIELDLGLLGEPNEDW